MRQCRGNAQQAAKGVGQQAARYERNEQRQGCRSGHYNRNLTTTSRNVTLKVPKLKGISFEAAIIERYCRRESSVEETIMEMYLADVSVRLVEEITEALWDSKVSLASPNIYIGISLLRVLLDVENELRL